MEYELSHEHRKWNRKHNCLWFLFKRSVSENNLLEITLILMVREDSCYRMLAKGAEKSLNTLSGSLPATQEEKRAGDVLFTPDVCILLEQRHLFRHETDQDLVAEDSPSAFGLGFLLWGLKTLDWALHSSTTYSIFVEAGERKVWKPQEWNTSPWRKGVISSHSASTE